MKHIPFLHEERKRSTHQSDQVKDFSVFDFSFIPEEPIMREEGRYLIREIVRFETTSIPTHQAVLGAKGSGKTLTLRYLEKIMNAETKLNVLYANCREHNTSFKIFAYLLGVQPRGVSMSELYTRFCEKHQERTVVVLDEVDLMSPKDKRRDILYFLSRSENPYMVIMLSNNYRVLHELDDATKSSLQPKTVCFKPYDAEQLKSILHDRARQGLHRWDDGTLSRIAALTTKRTNSDARVAIKTLFYAMAEANQDIEACFEQARQDIITEMINNLSDPLLKILRAIATSHSDFAKKIYKRYRNVCTNCSEKPFSYVHYYANLSYLQSMGLIALISTKVACTYANRLMLTFDESVLDPICRLRFGS
ncbi:Cdc6/Cdc18 family protein [Planctomycetota bacterium]